MRIVQVCSGGLPIPPPGWGAVEVIVWDLTTRLQELGHEVLIVNERDTPTSIAQIRAFQPDVVHVHLKHDVLPHLRDLNVLVTWHCAHFDNPEDENFKILLNESHVRISVHAEAVRRAFLSMGCSPDRLHVIPNGANERLFHYSETCSNPDRSIYLALIDERKKQYRYQSIDSIDFFGITFDFGKFDPSHPNYKGQMMRDDLFQRLTTYANSVLLSDSETHSLSLCESLLAGLGVVASEGASANLDRSKPWITIIPTDKLEDVAYVEEAIARNRAVSIANREEIRKHALGTVAFGLRVQSYLEVFSLRNA